VLSEIAGPWVPPHGAVDFDIAANLIPSTGVADAFEELEQRHTHGKIVLAASGFVIPR